MLSITEIKVGSKIVVNDNPYIVLFSQHSKIGRAGAILRTKLKNLINGSQFNKTFQGSEKIKKAEIESKKAQYLYDNENSYFFMNSRTYEQFEINKTVIEDATQFLIEGIEIDVLYLNEKAINIELPIKMEFEVIESPPSIKGNTADGGTKQITIETGAKITVPLFIETGDKICINTQTGKYTSRAK